jgi:hypothetical protein
MPFTVLAAMSINLQQPFRLSGVPANRQGYMQPNGEVKRGNVIGSFAAASFDSATTSEDTAPIAPSSSLTIEAEHKRYYGLSRLFFPRLPDKDRLEP